MEIRHVEYQNGGSFTLEDGDVFVGEQTYRRVGDVLYIDHTEVDETRRGQGLARKLLDAAVAHARANGEKIVPLCSYSRAQFEKDPSIRDVLTHPPRPRE